MKKIIVAFILVFISIYNSYAIDNLILHGIQQARNSGEKFEAFSALQSANTTATHSRKFEELFINTQEVYVLHYSKPDTRSLSASLTLNIPLGNRSLQLELQENHVEGVLAMCIKTLIS